MLTDKDINRIIAVVATKQDIAELRGEVREIKDTLQRLIVSVDHLASTVDKLLLEYAAVKEQLDRHERWIREIAKKSKVSLAG